MQILDEEVDFQFPITRSSLVEKKTTSIYFSENDSINTKFLGDAHKSILMFRAHSI